MGRRKHGRDVHGWVVVDKPAGVTSTQVVGKVRWAFDARKAGHAGTLDPAATGILAVALGEATKTVPMITDALKTYAFTVRWGARTDTDDAEGTVVETSDARPTEAAIKDATGAFVGDILQTPPAFSAVKIDGARAYDLARAGETPTIAARPLWVEALLLTDVPDADHATFEMTCGKGGYVRAIARDLGQALGCLGHVRELRRIASGPFEVEDAHPMERIEALARTPGLDALLRPLEVGLDGLPECPVTAEAAARLRHGNPAPVATALDWDETAWASHHGRAVAIGQVRGGMLHPARVLAA
ncbi:MAG: tRNA pseudouridine(55) synthase TruB [Paracoccaceae bacterium]